MHAPFAWEAALCSRVGVTLSQLRFLIAMYLSVPLSLGPRWIGSRTGRHLYAIIVGILLLYYPFGSSIQHAFLPSLATYLGLKICPKKCSLIGWGITFPYLVFLHVVNASGESWKQGNTDFTGSQMLLVLKLISLSHCMQDGHSGKGLNTYQKKNAIYDCPSILEFISYIYSVGGLLGGPHFEYRDYKDFMDRSGVWQKSLPFSVRNFFRPLLHSFICAGLYFLLYPKFNFQIYLSDAFSKMSLFRRYWTTWLISVADRTKYYHVWLMAEVNVNISGFGYNQSTPEEGGDSAAKWERGCNVKPINVELANSFSLIASNWNISTGNFLRRYVYDRITPPGKKASFRTLLITQIISGVWHGLYAGYWLFFISTALCISTSRVIYKQTRKLTTGVASLVNYPLLLFTSITLAYMATSFQVLDFWECIATWQKLYFLPHIACLSVVLLDILLKKRIKSA